MKKFLAFLLIGMLCFGDLAAAAPVFAEDAGSNDMETGTRMFITLASNTKYRWNVNDSAEKGSVVHLDDSSGVNCQFRFDKIEDGWYGLKHIKDYGLDPIDRFVDVDDRSTKSGAALHVWEPDDKDLKGKDKENWHRYFAFYSAGTTSSGEKKYYIKNRNSGKWIGLESNDPKVGTKVVQTDEDRRQAWIVTPSVVPTSGSEENILKKNGGSSNSAYGQFNVRGNMTMTVNREDDRYANGTCLQNYNIGTSSKFRITWLEKYKAYEIEAVDDREKSYNPRMLWSGGKGGTRNFIQIHIASNGRDKNSDTEQLWRFVPQGDGTYKIRNARSGKYVVVEKKYLMEESGDGQAYEIDLFRGSGSDDFYDYSDAWMKDLPDDAYLSSINMPGTHDTGTAAAVQDAIPCLSLTSCQSYYYDEQLSVGARAFDIRCNAQKDKASPSDVNIIHGSQLWKCFDRDGSNLTLEDILSESKKFLQKYPSETIVLTVKPDAGSTEGLARAIGSFIKNNGDFVWKGSGTPSLGEARGKIVFVRRYTIDTNKYDPSDDGLQTAWFGPDLSDWDSHDYSAQKYAVKIYPHSGSTADDPNISFYVQDAYSTTAGKKWEYITGTMKQTTGNDPSHAIPADSWIYNYTSAATGFPLGLTRDINPRLAKDDASDGAGYIDNRRLGMVMLNFINGPLSKLIYETNRDDSKFFEPKVTFPDTISITYGQTLSQASFSGGSTGGTWAFEDKNYIPTGKDFKEKKTYKLTYTPGDKRLRSVTGDVAITQFVKKDIQVTIDDKTMTYGEAKPALTFSVDESQLVGNDTKADLGVSLELSSNADRLDAGEYVINGTANSENYNVLFPGKSGILTVEKKTVGITWSDTSNLVYTGDPVNVTATLTGILSGDDCRPVVEGGNEIGPSWKGPDGENPIKYEAKVTELTGTDEKNYQLPQETTKGYYIQRQDATNFVFPEKAELTYGQTLSQAELTGASGEGSFVFVEKDGDGIRAIGSEMPAAGQKEYFLAYIPKNQELEHAVCTEEKIPVTVHPKKITVQAEDSEKTYREETSLSFSFDETQLAAGDTKEGLKLTLSAGAGDEKKCDAGTYVIRKGKCENTNYDVTVKPGVLTVERKEVTLVQGWNGDFIYDGQPAETEVFVPENERKDEKDPADTPDDCQVRLVGGGKINAGESYTAVAISLSNKNYCMPADDKKRIFSYSILQADPDVTFPDSAKLTYGQTLAQAELSGEEARTEGTFSFTRSAFSPQVGESGNYELVFTPSDSANYKTVKQQVEVQVLPKEIEINIDNKEKVYGQETPELTWSMNESQLVGSDTLEDLNVSLSAGEGGKIDCDVGGYAITGQAQTSDKNYKVVCVAGTLKVQPLEVQIQWDDTSNLVYTGSPVGVGAKVANPAFADDVCTLVVKGGDETQPSWNDQDPGQVKVYEAEIVGMSGKDRFNYVLPQEGLTKKYLIRRAGAADYAFPTTASMTYGQKISQADLEGASGDGTFTFVDDQGKAVSDTVPDAGSYAYYMVFDPAEETQRSVKSDEKISLVVNPKKVTATAENAEKIYGEETILSYTFDESQLEAGDTKEDLALALTAVDEAGNSGDETKSPAGSYTIEEKSGTDPNYKVQLTTATLWIRQKVTDVIWSDVSDLSYTGKPADVTARAKDLLPGDTATVHVLGGDRIEPGSYQAAATSISNANYRLSTDEGAIDGRICAYTIKKADPKVTFPKEAVLTYGQSLAAAKLTGASGAGSFAFTDPAQMPEVKDSGKTQKMTFTPDDQTHYDQVSAQIPVRVQPVTVTLTWLGAEPRDYDGEPSNVRAVAGNLLPGDTCMVKVKNGNKTTPGTYTARATGLSNGNYSLPDKRTKKYTIRSANGVAGGASGSGSGGPAAGTSDPSDSMALIALLALLAVSAGAMGWSLRRKR